MLCVWRERIKGRGRGRSEGRRRRGGGGGKKEDRTIEFILFFVTPEGFTTVVANEGLEKARAYLNQVPRDRRLYIPSEGCGINFRWKHLQNTPTHFFGQS